MTTEPSHERSCQERGFKTVGCRCYFPITDSKWVSPTQVVPKKYGVTVVANEHNELIPTRVTTGWRVCIDYRKLNVGTRKDHFPLPFVDQMLERVAGHEFYCFLDGYSGYNQIEIALEDQEKTTFTLLAHLPLGKCPSDFVMHQEPSIGAWWGFLVI